MRKIESSGNTDLRDAVELPRRGQVAAERLFDDDARMLGQVRGAEPFDHRLEERGWDGEVVRRAPSAAQRLFDRRERARVVIVPAHVSEQGQKMVGRRAWLSIPPDRLMLSCHALCSCARLHFGKATPMTGTFRSPRFAIA